MNLGNSLSASAARSPRKTAVLWLAGFSGKVANPETASLAAEQSQRVAH